MLDGTISPHEAYMKAIDKKRFQAALPPEEAALANASGGAA
jgi:twitching motility protein PilT